MEQVKVSFIIPAYNIEPYIGQCMESVLKQSISKEIIVVNDGSTDRTIDIVREYAEKNACIRIIDKKNQGISCARNDGVLLAKGEFLCFLNGDDYYTCDFAGEFYKTCQENQLDIIRGWYIKVYPDGKQVQGRHTISYAKIVMSGYDFLANSVYERAIEAVSVLGFIRREYFVKHKLWFPRGLSYEDQYYFLNMLLCSKEGKIMQVDKSFYAYRMRECSITCSPTLKNLDDIVRIITLQTRLLNRIKLTKYYKRASNRLVASTLCYLISVYVRLPKNDRRKIDKRIPLAMKIRCLCHASNKRDLGKLILFLLCPKLLVWIYPK